MASHPLPLPGGTLRPGATARGHRGRSGDLPFYILSSGPNDMGHLSNVPSAMARIFCGDCPAHAERRQPPGQKMVPEAITKHFRLQLGWEHLNGTKWRCPECQAARKAKPRGESPKMVAPPPRPPLPKVKMREIALSLDVFYDARRERWLLGMGEAGVAELHGVSVDDVHAIRRMAVEKLLDEDSLDRELAAIRASIVDIRDKMSIQLEAYAGFETRLNEALSRCAFLERSKAGETPP